MTAQKEFRTDINGLRAVAVLSVLLYHFDLTAFRGGYVGVDVFFVISGFLMTQIVVTRLGEGRFSFAQFYAARLKRIVPALGVLCLLLLVAGFFWLTAFNYDKLGRDAFSSLLFKSNISYARKTAYFEAVSRERWLLHTWSLSVEAQFYLLYPFILIALHRMKRLTAGVALLLAASLAWAGFYTPHNPSSAFYLLPSRMWEFLAGGLVFLLPRPVAHLEKAGIALILAAVFLYPDTLAYPGIYALLPVAGAALVLQAQSRGVLLSNRVAQFFGDISYSLYLWHWPVVLVVKYCDVALTPAVCAAMTLAATLLAGASYRFVETPCRHWRLPDRRALVYCAAAVLAVALPALLVSKANGFPSRMPESVRTVELQAKDVQSREAECFSEPRKIVSPCHLGASAPATVALWGDSHANAVFETVDAALKRTRRGGVSYLFGSCMPSLGQVGMEKACDVYTRGAFDKISADPAVRDVLMVSRWNNGMNAAALSDTVCRLRKVGKRVHLLVTVPVWDGNVSQAIAKSWLLYGRDVDIKMTRAEYDARTAGIVAAFRQARAQCGAEILDPWQDLCGSGDCHAQRGGRALYRDEQHLTNYGAKFLQPLFERALGKK